MVLLIFLLFVIGTTFSTPIDYNVKLNNPLIRLPNEQNFIPLTNESLQYPNINFEKTGVSDEIDAIVNHLADQIFFRIESFILKYGFDPASMPDLKSEFSYGFILKFFGKMALTNGTMKDVSTIKRAGDVVIGYNRKKQVLHVILPLQFSDLSFRYKYLAKLEGIGPRGNIKGVVKGVVAKAQIEFDFKTYQANLKSFTITEKSITWRFTGNILTDWIANILTNVVTALIDPAITLFLKLTVQGVLNAIITEINDVMGQIL